MDIQFYKNIVLTTVLIIVSGVGFSQEICNNGVDDDSDGLIDLNDTTDCVCTSVSVQSSLVPNPSFEVQDCCPSTYSQLNCADTWVQATDATSDYLYDGCFIAGAATANNLVPPPHGSGFVGAIFQDDWKEYIGACLTQTMVAGTVYDLDFNIASTPIDGMGNECNNSVITYSPVDITIYGSNICNLPINTTDCPTSDPNWQVIGTVNYTPATSWQAISITLTPSIDVNAIMIGAPCTLPGDYGTTISSTCHPYFYFDNFGLTEDLGPLSVSSTGGLCTDDLSLFATPDTVGGTYQWYLDGVALVGETDSTLNVGSGPLGMYTVQYNIDTLCTAFDIDLSSNAGPTADFDFTTACVGNDIDFTDQSTAGATNIDSWDWDFGTGDTDTLQNPSYPFSSSGQQNVTLIVEDQNGCSDTITQAIDVDPVPSADFEFTVDGQSSSNGNTGGCINSEVFLTDLSSISNPGTIDTWEWDFGDGNGSSQQNPSHFYNNTGSYTITLVVHSTSGCTDTTTIQIDMSSGPDVDFNTATPSCYQYEDGSVTISNIGTGSNDTYTISDSTGTVLNSGGSNTVNLLGEGWYYGLIESDNGCSDYDSIFIDDPDPIQADIDVTDALCNGEASGAIFVTSVQNYNGTYDDLNFQWNPSVGVSGQGADTAYNVYAGTYELSLTDDNGCSHSVTIVVNEPDPVVLDYGAIPAMCRTNQIQTANGVVWANGSGGVGNFTYLWTDLQDSSTTTTSTWGARSPGDYSVVTTDANGCTFTQIVTVDEVYPLADFTMTDFTIEYEGTAPVDVHIENESMYYIDTLDPVENGQVLWSFDYPEMTWKIGEISPYDTTYSVAGTYNICVKVVNKYGCKDSTCKELIVHDPLSFDPVNVFTPGSDGANDVFTFEYLAKGVNTFHCTVVNRWGKTVKVFTSIDDYWDGTDQNGSECGDGVYYYVYEGTADNGEQFEGQGTVTLVREK